MRGNILAAVHLSFSAGSPGGLLVVVAVVLLVVVVLGPFGDLRWQNYGSEFRVWL